MTNRIQALSRERMVLLLLLGVSAVILLLGLGDRQRWGPETRWANISLQMIQSGNYFDPYLMGEPYYDKPLPSYWLITLRKLRTIPAMAAVRSFLPGWTKPAANTGRGTGPS